MLDLNDLRLFVHIVEHRGILRAGRALRLPKSTMSRRLSALEDQVKSRLVVRSGEDFELTAAGETAYALGRNMVDAAEAAEDRLLAPADDAPVFVSLVASALFEGSVARIVGPLKDRAPGLRLAVEIGDPPGAPGDSHDLHLRAHVVPLPDSALIQRRVCRSPMILAAAPAIAANLGAADAPERCMAAGFIAFWPGAPPAVWRFTDPAGGARMAAAAPDFASAAPGLLLARALAGGGAILAPEFALRDAIASGALVRLAAEWTGPAVAVTLLTPPRRLMSRPLRRVADALGAAVKAEVLDMRRTVPLAGRPVPELRPAGFAGLSHGAASPCRAAAVETSPGDQTLAESETVMTPFTKAAAAAAMTAVAAMQAQAQDADGPIVLYTNDFEGVITERFEADTGRGIDVVQMSGGELLARIAAEANNPQWDVLIFNGSYTMHGLDLQGQLKRGVEPANLSNLNETGLTYLPENRSWFPIGLVASCVMLYRNDLVETPPARFEDLADARFNGLFGMADPAVAAPAYPCVATFFHDRGEEAAKALFTSYFENGMRVFRTNGPTGRALTTGDIHLALITSQVAFSQIAAGEPLTVVWPEEGAPGSVRGAAISASTARPEGALAFIEWLLEPATQSYLASAVASDGLFEPTVTGAVRRADGPPEGARYRVAPDAFAVENEEAIKTWFADQALN